MSLDQAIIEFDRALRTISAVARSVRPLPGKDLPDVDLNQAQKTHVVGLMRVNHCGEICAQALYQGQSLTSSNAEIKEALRGAADEETEHLAWTEQRIAELGGHKSLLNPLLYLGSLGMGLIAGKFGDKWNLGFLAETERQVEAHLGHHLQQWPHYDAKSRAILQQMQADEKEHADTAEQLGAHALPAPVKMLMRFSARVMTRTAYYL